MCEHLLRMVDTSGNGHPQLPFLHLDRSENIDLYSALWGSLSTFALNNSRFHLACVAVKLIIVLFDLSWVAMKSFGAFGGMTFGLLDILLFYDGMVVLLVNAFMVFHIAGQHTVLCKESHRCVEVHLNRLLRTSSRREERAVRLRNELELDGADEKVQAKKRKTAASLEDEVALDKVLVADLR